MLRSTKYVKLNLSIYKSIIDTSDICDDVYIINTRGINNSAESHWLLSYRGFIFEIFNSRHRPGVPVLNIEPDVTRIRSNYFKYIIVGVSNITLTSVFKICISICKCYRGYELFFNDCQCFALSLANTLTNNIYGRLDTTIKIMLSDNNYITKYIDGNNINFSDYISSDVLDYIVDISKDKIKLMFTELSRTYNWF